MAAAKRLDIEEIRRQVRVRRLLAFVPRARTQVGDIRAAQLLASWKKRDRDRFADKAIKAILG
jgi:hypothetical protein